jgi:hypothetical protein
MATAADFKKLGRWIDLYLARHGPCLDRYLGHFDDNEMPIETAIDEAVRGKGKKIHPHQRHIGEKRLAVVAKQLGKIKDEIRHAKSFDDLHGCIRDFVDEHKLKGFGPVAIYDTALRLASRLGCPPEGVYLHAGAKEGYRKKFKRLLPTVEASGNKLDWRPVPPGWERLKDAHHVENFLCIFKDGEPKSCAPSECCDAS